VRPNAQVNRQKCEAFLSALNRQLAWWLKVKCSRRQTLNLP
jgi:hypothetical protein